MNIHFTDRNLFDRLKMATLAKVIVGSKMYGTDIPNISDTDYLYIYATSSNELSSCIQTHHQLQFVEDGIDHIFVSLHNFIKNTLSGDSTINFEVIHSNALQNTELDWINDYRDMFLSYSVIRSYIGLCRRDVKHFNKYNTDYEKQKRFGHIVRGVIYTRAFLTGHFDFNVVNAELRETIKGIDYNSGKELRVYSAEISSLRELLTKYCNENTLRLANNVNVDMAIVFNNQFLQMCNSEVFRTKQQQLINFDMSMFIDSYENWISY